VTVILYNYPVTFRGEFPLELLCQEAAWPVGPGDASVIRYSVRAPHRPSRTVWLNSHKPPTLHRWELHECIVGDIQQQPHQEINHGM